LSTFMGETAMMDPEIGTERALDRLLDAALPHLAFDGWSPALLKAAAADSGLAPGLVAALVPRGALDLALAAHRRGDRRMTEALAAEDLTALRFRERIARAVRLRIELAGDREGLRRSAAFFALPAHAAEGAALIWGTADRIWTALGDTSRDINWYSKRATLSAVYSSTVLYWMGDDSPGAAASWEFLDRRIENVMAFEKAKAGFGASAIGKALAGPLGFLAGIRAPEPVRDMPGHSER
jgi:ubiquinone biosynthesis protein COQ9